MLALPSCFPRLPFPVPNCAVDGARRVNRMNQSTSRKAPVTDALAELDGILERHGGAPTALLQILREAQELEAPADRFYFLPG